MLNLRLRIVLAAGVLLGFLLTPARAIVLSKETVDAQVKSMMRLVFDFDHQPANKVPLQGIQRKRWQAEEKSAWKENEEKDRAGFVYDGEAETRFGPAPRMHADVVVEG